MSYCVNCGVELSKDLKQCPLCNTPVINPKEVVEPDIKTVFPKEKGKVEEVKRKDFTLLISVVLSTTGITCFLLNLFVFPGKMWSLLVIGICVLLWVFGIPFFVAKRLSGYIYLLLDGISTIGLLYMITYLTEGIQWFWGLGIPIVVLVTVVSEIFVLCMKKFPISFLTTALYMILSSAILCVGLETMIDWYLRKYVALTWSAVVLTVCTIIAIMIITLLAKKRLRNAVRRRLHF